MAERFTDHDLRKLLAAVGLDQSLSESELSRSFEELGLDSLARMEIATRIQDDHDVDVEADLTADNTPEDLMRMVNARLTTAQS
ncbi:phosphopantetheine-binding protein [Nonomuraea sp. CA-141351]|uniref:phosphopantetheine-binding protein n=1 Tax=Nonomuraea sp. CA-141351 TaxID=3239996 RepID=UPI003D8D078C